MNGRNGLECIFKLAKLLATLILQKWCVLKKKGNNEEIKKINDDLVLKNKAQ